MPNMCDATFVHAAASPRVQLPIKWDHFEFQDMVSFQGGHGMDLLGHHTIPTYPNEVSCKGISRSEVYRFSYYALI